MSGIKGSKSKFYIKEPLPGIENSSDTLINVTTGELPGARIGLDVIQHGVYEVNNTGIVGIGSAQRIIECINHGASAGDVMKITSGNLIDDEIAIIGVIDADNFVIAYEANLAVGDSFSVLRYVSARYDQSGSLQVSSGPIQFTKNGSAELVVEDTVTPANNQALPSKMFILKDGVQLPVTKDTGTPSNNVAVPVELVGAAGPINITAGDLNVQLTDLGANFDRTRIGDGVNQLAINTDGSINTGEIAKSVSDTLFFDYSSSPVDNTAWVQLIPATADASKHLTWFESGGYAMEVGIGAIGLETRAFVIPPGGLNGQIDLPIPAGVRVSIRCLEAVTVNVGTIVSNLLK